MANSVPPTTKNAAANQSRKIEILFINFNFFTSTPAQSAPFYPRPPKIISNKNAQGLIYHQIYQTITKLF